MFTNILDIRALATFAYRIREFNSNLYLVLVLRRILFPIEIISYVPLVCDLSKICSKIRISKFSWSINSMSSSSAAALCFNMIRQCAN